MKIQTVATLIFCLWANLSFGGWLDIEEKRLSTKMKVSDFNQVSSEYMERPTFVSLRKLSSNEAIFIDYTPYGVKATGIFIPKKSVDDALIHIAKYKQWNEQAKTNGDSFEKDIGKIPSAAGIGALFSFYSGNAKNHYLIISSCALGMCTKDTKMFFDEKNVNELELLLTKFKNGELVLEDVSKKYN